VRRPVALSLRLPPCLRALRLLTPCCHTSPATLHGSMAGPRLSPRAARATLRSCGRCWRGARTKATRPRAETWLSISLAKAFTWTPWNCSKPAAVAVAAVVEVVAAAPALLSAVLPRAQGACCTATCASSALTVQTTRPAEGSPTPSAANKVAALVQSPTVGERISRRKVNSSPCVLHSRKRPCGSKRSNLQRCHRACLEKSLRRRSWRRMRTTTTKRW